MRAFAKRVRVLHMDTLAAAAHVPDGSLDFVFIDADHSYEAVAADIDAWRSKVKPGGILSGHDYGHRRFPGVAQAVDERFIVEVLPDNVWWVRC
jgi:predicted O-methyltransferase YrrM